MKKVFAAVICVLLSVIVCMFSGCDTLLASLEEEETTLPFSTSRTEQPNTKEAVVDYYNALIEHARAGRAGVSRNIGYEINDLKIVGRDLEGVTDENGAQQSDPELEALNAAGKELRSLVMKTIRSNTVSAAFGEEWGDAAPNTVNAPASVETANCVMGEEETAEAGDPIVYNNFYYGTIGFGTETYPLAVNSALKPVFPYPDEETIKEELAKMSDYLVLEDYDCVFTDNTIDFSAERLADEIDYANYTSNVQIIAHAEGVGTLESYGELTVLLTLKCTNNYTFDWVDPSVEVTD